MNGWAASAVSVMVVIAGAGAVGAPRQAGDALFTLVEAERAFARMSVQTSQRDAFLAHFADDGVWFAPGPANTKEALRKRAAGPEPQVLDWDPVTGDVASSGDLGYTTGPWIASERAAGAAAKKLRTGWFFSVWSWRGDTGWKVLADCGVDAPHNRTLRARTFARAATRAQAPNQAGTAAAMSEELRAADVEFAKRLSAAGWAAALADGATDDVRIYRDGHEPAVGSNAAAALLTATIAPFSIETAFSRASAAGDLGLTYGSYAAGAAPNAGRGYYLHVWKRRAGSWKLAVDVGKADPRERR